MNRQGDMFAPGAEATMAFVLRLRARGIANVAVLRALETVPRHLFVSHLYADLAWRDIALPIACGQTMPEPHQLARILEALDVAPAHRVLEIGAGSGYTTAILARLGAEVVAFERYRTLATEAAVRLRELGFHNARVVHGDGLAPPADLGAFDRIFIDGAVEDVPADIMALLARQGRIVYVRSNATGEGVLTLRADTGEAGIGEAALFAVPAIALVAGKSTTF